MAVRSSRGRHAARPTVAARPAHHRAGAPRFLRRMAPLLAFVAVVLIASGGLWVAARPSGPERTVGLVTGTAGKPAAIAPDQAGDRGSRGGREVPALGTVAPARTTAAATTPAATASRARTPAMPSASPSSAVRTTAPARTTTSPTTAAPSSTPAGEADVVAEVARLTNLQRSKAGCGAVRVDSRLNTAALGHSEDMVDRDYFDHISPDGEGPGDRAAAAGYPSWSGENIAVGYATAAAVMQAWMDSPGHRANILNCDSKATGVGFDPRKNMWTQMFGFV